MTYVCCAVILWLGTLRGHQGEAQTDQCLHRTVPVTVLDPAGRFVTNLSVADFEAKFRGKPVQILGLTRDTNPRRVLILLDVSGSMLTTERGKWQMALEVVGDAVAHLPAETRVALSIFDERIRESLDFSAGRKAVAERVIALKAGANALPSKTRRTALWDSLLKAVSLFGQPGPGDAVYLISDGGDNLSKTSPRQVEEAFLEAGARLFTFLLISRSQLGYLMPDEQQGLNALKELSESTGGDHIVLAVGGKTGRFVFHLGKDARAAVVRAAQDIYAQMKDMSWLEISLPLSVDKPREWSLQLNLGQNKVLQRFELRYPHKLLPCSVSLHDN
jgi:hypothetical protein